MMTDAKCREVLDRYETALGNTTNVEGDVVKHLSEMIPKMRVMLDAVAIESDAVRQGDSESAHDNLREKFMRWLGFLQGAMWAEGWYTIDELKAHNRPTIKLGQDWVTRVTSEEEP